MPAALPNLFVIGAMKSGTSTLCRLLGEHPDIFACPAKEPMHFSREENYGRGDEPYLRLYRSARRERYLLDGSTEYAKRPQYDRVAERIHAFNPEARIVYLMRDPVERILSQYKHMARHHGEQRPLLTALAGQGDYLVNSHYAYQLRPYVEQFGLDAIYLDTFERLVAEPGALCRDLFAWLGVDAAFKPASLGVRQNDSPTRAAWLDSNTKLGRTLMAAGGSRLVRAITPRSARRWVRLRVGSKAAPVFGEAFQQDAATARAKLAREAAGWVEELTELTGRTFDDWPSAKRAPAQHA